MEAVALNVWVGNMTDTVAWMIVLACQCQCHNDCDCSFCYTVKLLARTSGTNNANEASKQDAASGHHSIFRSSHKSSRKNSHTSSSHNNGGRRDDNSGQLNSYLPLVNHSAFACGSINPSLESLNSILSANDHRYSDLLPHSRSVSSCAIRSSASIAPPLPHHQHFSSRRSSSNSNSDENNGHVSLVANILKYNAKKLSRSHSIFNPDSKFRRSKNQQHHNRNDSRSSTSTTNGGPLLNALRLFA